MRFRRIQVLVVLILALSLAMAGCSMVKSAQKMITGAVGGRSQSGQTSQGAAPSQPAPTSVTTVPVSPANPDGNKLVAEYKLAGDANDATGNGHDGTVVGNVSFASGSPVGQCAVFDGTSYIQVADSPGLGLTGPYTISAWVKVDQQGSDMGGIKNPVISKTDAGAPSYNGTSTSGGSTYEAYGLQANMFTVSEEYYGGASEGFTNQYTSATNIDLTDGWCLVTATNDGAKMYLYVNGALKDTKPVTSPVLSSTGDVMIGAQQDGGANVYLKGRLADLRIYNYALGGDDITALYNAVFQGSPK